MSVIINVHARQILDSRGNPTVEVDVVTENDVLGRFICVLLILFFLQLKDLL